MAEFPSLPLFTDAYLGDTTHLTTFEHGAYLLLIIVSWRSPGCRLPDDDQLLARYTRMTRDKWRKVRPTLAPFFSIEDGFWHQARLQKEFRHLRSRSENAREAGRASAAVKSLRKNGARLTGVGPTLQRIGNGTPTPTPIPTYEEDIAPTTSGSPPRAPAREAAPEELPLDLIDLTDRLARLGGVRHIEPGQIIRHQDDVRSWLEAGADPALLTQTVTHVLSAATGPIRSLRYFDGAVRRAIATNGASNDGPDTRRQPRRDPLVIALEQARAEELAEDQAHHPGAGDALPPDRLGHDRGASG